MVALEILSNLNTTSWGTGSQILFLLPWQASCFSRPLWTMRPSVSTVSPSVQWITACRHSPPPRLSQWRWVTWTTSHPSSLRTSTTPLWPRTGTLESQWSGSLPLTWTQVTVIKHLVICFTPIRGFCLQHVFFSSSICVLILDICRYMIVFKYEKNDLTEAESWMQLLTNSLWLLPSCGVYFLCSMRELRV